LLRQHCEKKLKEAEARIEKLSIGADGSARAEAFDA
jgi:exonuclease VII small subunit